MSEEEGRTPPHSIEAEQAVLGAIFVDPTCFSTVLLILKAPSMFWRLSHQHIYEACRQLFAEGLEVDWVSVGERLQNNGKMHECGGSDELRVYLSQISHEVPSAYGAESYAVIVRDCATRRAIIAAATAATNAAFDRRKMPGEAVSNLGKDIDWLRSLSHGLYPKPMSVYAAEALVHEKARREWIAGKEPGTLPGIGSGLSDLDEMTSGWMPGYVTTLGMRPGQGKTTLGLQWADYAATTAAARRDDGKGGALVISTEMRGTELAIRKLAAATGQDSRKIMRGHASKENLEALEIAARETENFPLAIVDNAEVTVGDIRAMTQTMIEQHGTELVVIDYLQNLRAPRRKMDRFERTAENMESIRLMARDLEVHVILLSQLNRDYDKRAGKNKTPRLSDLADSSVIEAASATVILGHSKKETPVRAEIDLLVEKNRFGPSGTVECIFDKPRSRVLLKAKEEQGEGQEFHNWHDPEEKRET